MGNGLLRRLMDRFVIPWYDRAEAEAEQQQAVERQEHTEAIRQGAIAARISSEKVRADYAAMSRKLGR